MRIIQISGNRTVPNEGWLYEMLEHLDTFTLMECRGRRQLRLKNITHTLILDHLDEAESPSEILQQVMSVPSPLKTLVVVASGPCPGICGSDPDDVYLHIAMGKETDPSERSNVVRVNDLDMAISLVKDSLMQAA